MRLGRRWTVVVVLLSVALLGRCNAARMEERLTGGSAAPPAVAPVQPPEDLPPCERAERAVTGASSLITYALAHPGAAPATDVEAAIGDLSRVVPAAPPPIVSDVQTVIVAFTNFVAAHEGDPSPTELSERLQELAPEYQTEEYHSALTRVSGWLREDCAL